MNGKRVVITGMGAVTGFGFDWQSLWQRMLDGEHCIRAWQPEGVEPGSFPVRYAAPVDLDALPLELAAHPAWSMALERRSRLGWLVGWLAASQAVRDSGLGAGDWRDAALFCASGAPQHDLADMLLCDGRGGADSVLSLDTLGALYLLGAASSEQRWGERLCRPFERHRSGLVAGEGGGFLVLESLERALARGATPYAEILGYGSSLDGYKVTAPDPEGRGAVLAMQAALDDAGLAPGRIDLINAHGTSTPLNDATESEAIKQVFAVDEHYRRLAVTANKSQFGHLIAAAGAPELIATALSCRDDRVPPTLNLDAADERCDLDYTPHRAVSRQVDVALSNSFGFGGLNTSLVVGKYRETGR